MLHHISQGGADLTRAGAFYNVLLAPLGYVLVFVDGTALSYSYASGDDELSLQLVPEVPVPGSGCHLALAAGSRDQVDAARELGRSLNAENIARIQATFSSKSGTHEGKTKRPEDRQLVIEEMENYRPLDKLVELIQGIDTRALQLRDLDVFHVDNKGVTLAQAKTHSKMSAPPCLGAKRILRHRRRTSLGRSHKSFRQLT
jgi:hypothetical protein